MSESIGSRYHSRPHSKEEKKKQKREWEKRRKEEKRRRKREEKRKKQAPCVGEPVFEQDADESNGLDLLQSFQNIQEDSEEKVSRHKRSHTSDCNNEQNVIFKRKKMDNVDECAGSGLIVEKRIIQRDDEHENPVSASNAGIIFSRGKKLVSLAAKMKMTRPEVSSQSNSRVFNKSRTGKSAEDRGNPETRLQAVQELDPSLLIKTDDKPIGSGTFGNVFLAMYRGMKTVVKEMKKRDESRKETERCKQEVLHEAKMLRSLGDHPNLPFLFGVLTEREPYAIVIQFLGTGEETLTLHKVVRKRMLHKKSTANVFKAIAETLEHIHSRGIVHNDLKSNNVIIQRENGGRFQPIIIDFGKSEEIKKLKAYRRKGDYLAPEVREGKKQSLGSDIFSFGKMLESSVSGRSFFALFTEIINITTSEHAWERPSAHQVMSAINNIVLNIKN